MVPRRRALHLLVAGLTGSAGCAARDRDGTRRGTPTARAPGPSRPTATATSTRTEEPTPAVEIEGVRPTWTRRLGEVVTSGTTYADGILVVATERAVHGLDAETGETAWTFESPFVPERRNDIPVATVRVHEGNLYALIGVTGGLGSGDFALLSLRLDGTERWRYESDVHRYHEFVGFGGGAIVLPTHDDDISASGETILAVDRTSGEERWRADTGDAFSGAVAEDIATIEVTDHALDCFDVGTGDRRFRFAPEGGWGFMTSAIGDGRVFAAIDRDDDGPALYALEPGDGSIDWTSEQWSDPTVRYLDDLYVGGETIRRLGPDGTERWRYDGGGATTGVPVDGKTMFTNTGSHVVAIRRRDGGEQWRIPASDQTLPVARGGDSILTWDARVGQAPEVDHLIALDVDDGRERWRVTAPDVSRTIATGAGDAYLATRSGTLLGVPI